MISPTNDPFYSAKRRVSNAKRHIRKLDAECGAFFQSNPYTRIVDIDIDGTTQLHKVKLVREFPDEIGDIAADIVDNLRSALDQTGYAAAIASGSQRLKYTAFPFGNESTDVENAIAGWSKDIPSDITSFFRTFEPYKGGKGVSLWALNQLCISNKHTVLIPIGTSVMSGKILPGIIKAPEKGSVSLMAPMWTPSTWDRVKNEMIIGRVEAGGQFDINFELGFDVAFGDVPIFADKSAISTLNGLTSIVESIVVGTEAECRRLGFVN
jgi:hypothetical protein